MNKSETFTKIRQFIIDIKKQYHSNIHSIRLDNGIEFTSGDFQHILKSNGIHHQFSCTYTSQQNGRIKRKHKHILQVARSIMLHSHIPLKFCGGCILRSVYLINITSTIVLDNDTPYYRLFRQIPSYSYLKVFGCLCCATINTNKSKFDQRAIKGVFLEYSFRHKGYKVLNLETRNIIISRDVSFHERIFPFREDNTSNVS